jgi:hypothetical protein
MVRDLIRAAAGILFSPGQTVEVRAIGKRGTASGYFDDPAALADRAYTLDRGGEYAGIYVTLNPVNPALLSRRANRIEPRLGNREATTADGDITRRVWLPVDLDPVRPSGVSSSEPEHAAALEKAARIAEYLSALGWPAPVMADSGNGAHLLYRIDLPNDDLSRDLVKGVLASLDTLFSDARCTVDTANHNAARIWKLYGTTSRKGDNTEDRPHRRAAILPVPDDITAVSTALLTRLAGMFPKMESFRPTAKDRRVGEPIVLAGWLTEHGIGYRQKPCAGGDLFILDECPFSSDHRDGAYCIQFSSGAIFAGCHHSSCGGGSQRWGELREKYEGSAGDRLKAARNRTGRETAIPAGEPAPPSPKAPDQPAVRREASRILQEGDPLGHMLETFAGDHIGDPVVAECLVMSLASRQVINAKGLHVSVTGESGKGKSHTFDTMLQQVPEELRLEGRMSDKALFYIRDMKPGTVIALDDVSLSDQMQEVLKGVTTSFRKPFKYRTVNKDRGGETCIIPERCVWWVAKVEGTGDDQVWNRMLTCWIDDSEQQDAKVLARTLSEAAAVPAGEPGIRREVAVCQEMWRMIAPVHVVVPFAGNIRFSSDANRRNPDMLLDLVKCHAVLMQFQRDRREAGSLQYITATVDDFRKACRLYTALNGTSGGQQSKLTKKESGLIDAIRTHGTGEITISEMQHITGWSHSVIYKMLHGSVSHGYQYSGLLEKCPAISVCDRTVVTDEGGITAAHRRAKAYAWDSLVYDLWAADGGCWLDGHGPNPSRDDDDPAGGNAEGNGITAEVSETKRDGDRGSEENIINNNNFFSTYIGKRESIEQGISGQSPAPVHTYEFENSAERDPGPPSDNTAPLDSETGPAGCCPGIRNLSRNAPDAPQGQAGSAHLSPSLCLPEIRTRDYTRIRKGSDPGPCDCCGSRRADYREKMTPGRSPSRKICRTCYREARQAETTPVRALPGVLNIPAMVRIEKDLGRCQVCNGGKAAWHDPAGRVAICESCYHTHAGEAGVCV